MTYVTSSSRERTGFSATTTCHVSARTEKKPSVESLIIRCLDTTFQFLDQCYQLFLDKRSALSLSELSGDIRLESQCSLQVTLFSRFLHRQSDEVRHGIRLSRPPAKDNGALQLQSSGRRDTNEGEQLFTVFHNVAHRSQSSYESLITLAIMAIYSSRYRDKALLPFNNIALCSKLCKKM